MRFCIGTRGLFISKQSKFEVIHQGPQIIAVGSELVRARYWHFWGQIAVYGVINKRGEQNLHDSVLEPQMMQDARYIIDGHLVEDVNFLV